MDAETESSPTPNASSAMSRVGIVFFTGLLGALMALAWDYSRGRFDAVLPDVAAPSDAQIREGVELLKSGARKSSAFGNGCAAAILVAGLGLCHGLLCHSVTRSSIGLVLGLVLGGAFGALGGYLTQELKERAIHLSVPTSTAWLQIASAFWFSAGIGAAILGLLAGSRKFGSMTRFFVPLVGAGLSAGFVPMIGSIVYPLTFKGQVPPQTFQEAMLVGVSGALFFGVSMALLLRPKSPPVL